eukprot:3467533-Rhodomonas_salina.1
MRNGGLEPVIEGIREAEAEDHELRSVFEVVCSGSRRVVATRDLINYLEMPVSKAGHAHKAGRAREGMKNDSKGFQEWVSKQKE